MVPAGVVTLLSDCDISDHNSAPVASATSSKVTAGCVSGATVVGEMPAVRSAACRSTSSRMRAEARPHFASSTAVTSRLSRPVTRASTTPAVRSGVHTTVSGRLLQSRSPGTPQVRNTEPTTVPPVSNAPSTVAPASVASPAANCPQQIGDAKPGLQAMNNSEGVHRVPSPTTRHRAAQGPAARPFAGRPYPRAWAHSVWAPCAIGRPARRRTSTPVPTRPAAPATVSIRAALPGGSRRLAIRWQSARVIPQGGSRRPRRNTARKAPSARAARRVSRGR